jgi:hypothetical protein
VAPGISGGTISGRLRVPQEIASNTSAPLEASIKYLPLKFQMPLRYPAFGISLSALIIEISTRLAKLRSAFLKLHSVVVDRDLLHGLLIDCKEFDKASLTPAIGALPHFAVAK